MKRLIIIQAVLALTLVTVSAHALTNYNYDSSFLRNVPLTLEGGDTWIRSNAFSTPTSGFTDAYLELTLTGATPGALNIPGLTVNNDLPPLGFLFAGSNLTHLISAGLLTTGVNTFHLNAFELNNLNSFIHGTGIPFGIFLANGSISLTGARLYGNVAPEPASIALFGAGLVALPFARRIKNSIKRAG
jgi:hypothetical protein